ncbi:putative quinol monooxygenase [Candidatus Protofrankia datiscae]|uniref:Antibiotic biosynthesis monooxygenase n=1 Tax=Candidatus Protofrankia datiscae TaxID=2716812 RepID=F8B626_9ACTN|nr:antibiotic biosynthesis monooxygenase [Candidatus Protofrankia datiscae]AEH10124.1 Antibiotic biosynthesis monooxygenase [Candidatus Protofrankia datiscae]
MFALVVRFDLTSDGADGFDRLVAETVPLILTRESGTLLYVTHIVEGAPLARIFYEVYADRAAFDAHEEQAHVKRFLAEREQYLSAPARVEFVVPGPAKGVPAGAR